MIIRPYQTADCEALARLFYDTVHTVNAKDYTEQQLNAWATGTVDLEAWDRSLTAHFTLVAEENGVITGFGDMDSSGYLDRLYVHRDFQGKGIASVPVSYTHLDVYKRQLKTVFRSAPAVWHRSSMIWSTKSELRPVFPAEPISSLSARIVSVV